MKLFGALLLLLGDAGPAVPLFATHQLTNVATIGELKLQADEKTTHFIPQSISIVAVVPGVALPGLGIVRSPARP